MFKVRLLTENALFRQDVNIKKRPPTFVGGHYVGITYFHGQSPGNYRRRTSA